MASRRAFVPAATSQGTRPERGEGGKVQGQERPSRSTGVEYEDAGRDGLSESTGAILGLMPFGCGGEEVDMGRGSTV